MTTIQERIEAAHNRASARYSLTYAITTEEGTFAFTAIKKLLPSESALAPGVTSPGGASMIIKRAELVLTRQQFDEIKEAVPSLKDATVLEIAYNGATVEWKIDAREPFIENDPTGATVRMSIYQRTKAQ